DRIVGPASKLSVGPGRRRHDEAYSAMSTGGPFELQGRVTRYLELAFVAPRPQGRLRPGAADADVAARRQPPHPPVDRLGDAPIGGAGHSGTEHRSLDARAVAFGQPAEVGAAFDEGAAPQNEEVAGVPGHLHVRP